VCGLGGGRVWIGPPLRCAVTGIADLQNAFAAGKVVRTAWQKTDASASSTSWYDGWNLNPNPGDYSGTVQQSRVFTDTSAGSLYIGGTLSPANRLLTKVRHTTSLAAPSECLTLYDRIVDYPGCAVANTLQNMSQAGGTATRWNNTLGGLKLLVTASGGTGATASNWTSLAYNNQHGNAATIPITTNNKIITASLPTTSGSQGAVSVWAGGTSNFQFGPFVSLAAGDSILQVNSYQMDANNTGSLSFVVLRLIAMIQANPAAHVVYDYVKLYSGALQLIPDGTCLSFLVRDSTLDGNVFGDLEMVYN
jgi:hypothetical protein